MCQKLKQIEQGPDNENNAFQLLYHLYILLIHVSLQLEIPLLSPQDEFFQ